MPTYDDSASLYFFITLCVLYAVPGTFYLFKRLFSKSSTRHDEQPRSDLERIKSRNNPIKNDSNSKILSAAFVINLILVIIAWIIIIVLSNKINNSSGIVQFEPYSILGIEIGASEREIKKAYHTLSLRYHPDRNRGNKDAEKMFMMIAKAYESLTDPVSRENYEKYGNPDGKQALEISIGLPSFLLDKNFQTILLVIYLIVIVIVIPTAVCLWYKRNQKYSPKKVLKQTYGYFYQSIDKKINLKGLPELYIGAFEFHPRLLRNQIPREIDEIKPMVSNAMKRFKVKHAQAPAVIKGVSLLHAQFSRIKLSELTLQSDLQFLLENSPQLIEALLEMCFYRGFMQLGLSVMQFSQYLRQAMWDSDSLYKQIPHLDSKQLKVKDLDSGSPEFKQFCQKVSTSDGQDEISKLRLNDTQKQEIIAVCKVIPQVEVIITFPEDDSAENNSTKDQGNQDAQKEEILPKNANKKQKGNQKVKNEDEKKIYVYQGDVITMNVKIIRHEINDGEKIGFAYTPYFPLWVKEKLWVVIGTSQNRFLGFTQIPEDTKVVEKSVPIRIPVDCPSVFPLEIFVKSDTYVGVDQKFSTKIHILPANSRPNYIVHEEDKNLDKQTLFGLPTMSDSDSESDDEGDDSINKNDLNFSDDDNEKDQKEEGDEDNNEKKEQPQQETQTTEDKMKEELCVEVKQQSKSSQKYNQTKSKKGHRN